MALEMDKSTLLINQMVVNKNEKITIEGDWIIPDAKPDVLDIIGTSGNVNIYKKEISEGKIRIDGGVSVYVMYTGSEDGKTSVRSLANVLDFSQIIVIPDAKENMHEIGDIKLEKITCQIINERKIKVKAFLSIGVRLSTNTNVDYINEIKTDNIQKLESKENINTVIGMGSTKASINEIINMDNADNLAEILKVDTNIVNIDTKASYNKVLVKADVIMSILYSTEDGRYNTSKNVFPIMGFIDIKDITEEHIIQANIKINNTIIKAHGSQDHTISLDMEAGIDVIVYENREIEVVKDMYSTRSNLKFEQKSIEAMSNMNICKSTMNYSKKELIDIGDERIYDISTKAIITDVRTLNNTIIIKGNIQFDIIHSLNKDNSIGNKKIDNSFEYKIVCDKVNENSIIEINHYISNENTNILPGGEIDFSLDITFNILSYNITKIELISNVEERETKVINPYNMVIYYTQKEDTLWKIAKEFRSTREKIIQDNELEKEELQPGMQLFIQ